MSSMKLIYQETSKKERKDPNRSNFRLRKVKKETRKMKGLTTNNTATKNNSDTSSSFIDRYHTSSILSVPEKYLYTSIIFSVIYGSIMSSYFDRCS